VRWCRSCAEPPELPLSGRGTGGGGGASPRSQRHMAAQISRCPAEASWTLAKGAGSMADAGELSQAGAPGTGAETRINCSLNIARHKLPVG
jgi:hypothetical protein